MASTTPPNLSAQTAVASGDLMLVWPVGSGGPLQNITYANFKTQLVTDFGGTFLKPANNLSEVLNAATARTNLGLGTAAIANIGTSGATVPALNTANTWSGDQSFATNVTLGDASTDTVIVNAKSVTKPNMPAFLARMAAGVTNKTGDGTAYTVVWDTETFDRGGDWNGTTFTTPITGIYQFNIDLTLTGVLTAHTNFTLQLSINGSTVDFTSEGDLQPDSNARASIKLSGLIPLSSANAITVVLTVAGSTKVVGILGDAGNFVSTFSVYLVG